MNIHQKKIIFTFSTHTEYVKREIIVIAWVKKNALLLMNVYVLYDLEDKTSKKNFLSVCLSVCTYVRTWTFHVDTITFEGVSGSKQNLVGVFYVWNVRLVLKSKLKSWSWSWSSSWKGFWFWKQLCGTTPNFMGIFKTQSITFVIDFASGILILKKKNLKKFCRTKLNFMSIINM